MLYITNTLFHFNKQNKKTKNKKHKRVSMPLTLGSNSHLVRITPILSRFQAICLGHLSRKPFRVRAMSLTRPVEKGGESESRFDGGNHIEILFNQGQKSESVFNGEIFALCDSFSRDKRLVRFCDGHQRIYDLPTLKNLESICQERKQQLGIGAFKVKTFTRIIWHSAARAVLEHPPIDAYNF